MNDPDFTGKGRLLRTGFFSLLLHITLAVILILSARPTITKIGPPVYRVTIRSFSPQGDGTPLGSPIPGSPSRTAEPPASPPGEKPEPVVHSKRTEKAEATKSRQKRTIKKTEKTQKVEKAEKGWNLEKRKSSLKSLHEAIEDIDKKAALEEIQRKVARRESSPRPSQGSTVSGSGTGTGTGTASGPGTGSGSVGSPSGGSPWGSSSGGSSALLERYKDMIWAKIRKEWTLPKALQGRTDLETTISVTLDKDGKIQKVRLEKSAGNTLFDHSAVRALKKAEPLPPIPEELNDDTVVITFHIEE
jgi:TonB family protein